MTDPRSSQSATAGHRIAVTGVGAITALGPDANTLFDSLLAGRCGLGPVGLFDVSGHKCRIAAEVAGLAIPAQAGGLSRAETLALHAAKEALHSARLDPAAVPLALAAGTTNTWIHEVGQLYSRGLERPSDACARHLVTCPQGAMADRLSSVLGGTHRRATLCSACSSGALAVVAGASWIELGIADRVLAGAADSLCLLTHTGFEAIGALSSDRCQPFDVDRQGMSLGEGAGFVVLEREAQARERGADVLAWLSGWALGSEAYHLTHPEPSGATAKRLITEAMRRAGLDPSCIDYINAHGTGTLANDAMEGQTILRCLGGEASRVWVSSCKGQIGHTLAASGAIEAVVSTLALRRGTVPPTGGLVHPDPGMPLRHVLGKGVATDLRAVLSNSFGFGGNGVVLAFEHANSGPPERAVARRRRSVLVSGVDIWVDAPPTSEEHRPGERSSASGEPPSPIQARPSPRQALSTLDADRSRRFDLFTALITSSAEETLRTCGRDRDSVGLVAGFCYGHVTRLTAFMERIALRGPRHAPPAEFPHLSPSSSSGNASAYLGLKGPAFVVADERLTGDAALDVAVPLIQSGSAEALVVAVASVADPAVRQALESLGLDGAENCSRVAAGSLAVVSEQTAHRWCAAPSAEIVATAVLRDTSPAGRTLREPADPEASLVVDLAGPGVISAALLGSAWLRVRRLGTSPPGGAIEVMGMSALAYAVQLLHRGAAREILVCTARAGCVSLVHLRAMPM